MRKFIIIDGNAIVHRAFHALPPLTAPDGRVTNAVYGFTSILLKILKDLKPDFVAATFDLAGPTFRHEEFEEYKSHRVAAPDELYQQIPLVKEVLGGFGIPIFEMAGYEADDILGTLAELAKKEGDVQVIIATGDLDSLQLVQDDKVVVFTMRKGLSDTVIYDEKAVMERYGLTPGQLNDYRGLKGDPSDNIPGVPGIGEKTASVLIQKFGGIKKLYAFLEEKPDAEKLKEAGLTEKLAQKLLDNKKQAEFSKHLSTIITNLPVPFSLEKADWRRNFDRKGVRDVFGTFGFASLLKRVSEIDGGQKETLALNGNGKNQQNRLSESRKSDPLIKDLGLENAKGILAKARENGFLIITQDAKEPGAILVSPDGKTGFKLGPDESTAPDALKDVLEDEKIEKIGHDIKAAAKLFLAKNIVTAGALFDTKIAAYLLSPEGRGYDLEQIYRNEFSKELAGDPDKMLGALLPLKNELSKKIKEAGLEKIFYEIEMPLIPVLAEMEANGIKINPVIVKKLLIATNSEVKKIEKKIYKLAGEEFNINSPSQLGDIIFDKLELKGKVRKTGGGALSTAASELEKLKDEHPIVNLILDYRELQKLKTTYIEPFPTMIHREDGRVHTTFEQTGTATGRLASQDPNLQNIPIRTELGRKFRKAFVAPKGYKLTSLDYSQLELRVVAKIADDKKMIEAFQNGEDIHTRTAVEVFEVPPEKITPHMRREAKVLNFGIIYGMGPIGFSRAAEVTTARAREFMTKYFAEFSGIKNYMDNARREGHKNKYVVSLFGRRRDLENIDSRMPQLQSQAERIAINMPVQGTAADLMKMAMIKAHQYLKENFKPDQAKMLLQVHDELVFEIKDNLVKEITSKVKKIMEGIYDLGLPIIAEAKAGANWSEMIPIK